jgi:hypothetical protein
MHDPRCPPRPKLLLFLAICLVGCSNSGAVPTPLEMAGGAGATAGGSSGAPSSMAAGGESGGLLSNEGGGPPGHTGTAGASGGTAGASGGAAGASGGAAGASGGAAGASGETAGASGEAAGASGSGGASGRPLGAPISAPPRTWTWVDFPGAHCRDGSPTGIGVNWETGSDKLVIFLEGGGACFSPQSCAGNPSSRGAMFGGPFDRGAGNPFASYNWVYLPYCTGDCFGGNNPNGNVPGVGRQQFVGYANLELFLDRVVPTFPNVKLVVLTGSSAGGMGTVYNASHIARRFGTVPVVALDDSGPPMSADFMPACFPSLMRTLWGLDSTVLADCGTDCPNKDDFLVDSTMHFARGPNHSVGILNSYDDATDISVFNQGGQTCGAPVMATAAFERGLLQLRTAGGGSANRFATFYVPSTNHVWLGNYGATVNGTMLGAWVNDLVNGVYDTVGP